MDFQCEKYGGDLRETEAFLYALRNAGSKYSLERISALADTLGNPQNKYPIVHVAGTNGKGSLCAMVEAILRESGLHAGLYTSPHLLYLGERVQIDRVPIPKAELVARVREIRALADSKYDISDNQNYPSFFELMTLLAFKCFADKKVDAAVVEVGLGGRLDSTNIVLPSVCAITSIGLDHTALLGDTLAKIAREKAGIIKSSVPVVCGFLPPEAMEVVRETAALKGAPLYEVSRFYPDENSLPRPQLNGLYQRRNAATATIVAKVLCEISKRGNENQMFSKIDNGKISAALSKVSWAARWEEYPLENGATLILDASHNEEGARALEENLVELGKKNIRPVLAMGVLGMERAAPLFKVAVKYAKALVLFVPNEPRACNFEELESCLPSDIKIPIYRSTVEEFYAAKKYKDFVGKGDTLISTGSIYLAGEVIGALKNTPTDNLQDRPYPKP